MKVYDCIIIGGGASGLTAGASTRKKTLILESEDRVGKKILATGNGRCNLSNSDMRGEYYSSPEFFQKVYDKYDGKLCEFWKRVGLFTRVDSSGRIYPFSLQASTVLDTLRFESEKNCEIKTDSCVKTIQKQGELFLVKTDKESFLANSVIYSCGGGDNGLLREFGLKTKPCYPMLCPIATDTDKIKGLDGVKSQCEVKLLEGGRVLYREVGEVLFRTYGVSGIAVFNCSAFIARSKSRGERKNFEIELNLLHGLDSNAVQKEIEKRIKAKVQKDKLLVGILSNKIASAVLRFCEIDGAKIVESLTSFRLSVKDLRKENAQVQSGGIEISELKENLECKSQKGLFIVGEVVDMDGLCGGYNLHWAFLSAIGAISSINE